MEGSRTGGVLGSVHEKPLPGSAARLRAFKEIDVFPRAPENVPNAADVLVGILAPAGWDGTAGVLRGRQTPRDRASQPRV